VLPGSEPLSPRNSRVKHLREIARSRASRESEGVVLVEGAVLIGEAISAGWNVIEEFVGPEGRPVSSAPCFELSEAALERVATTSEPQPNVALVECRAPVIPVESRSVMVLDQLRDPGNVGTLIRSAEAAGLDAVVCTPGTADVFAPKTIRSSAGAVFHVPVVMLSLDDVVSRGFVVVATSSHRGMPYRSFDWQRKIAFILGNEAHGVDEGGVISEWVSIPQRGRSESLNVAMAGTLLAFALSDSFAQPE
jgi:TrmH family RNA methyltransferase